MMTATQGHLPSRQETDEHAGGICLGTQPLFFSVFFVLLALATPVRAGNTGGVGTSWQQHCTGIRTSFNPHTDLRSDALTLATNDPRWPAFLSWVQAQQIATFSLVGFRTSSAKQAARGMVFRWASGTPWERVVISPFGQALAHLLAERDWRDLDFASFFATRGGVYGINIAERLSLLDAPSLAPWQQFFQTITAPSSPSAPLLQARLSAVAPDGQSVSMTLGPDRVVTYSAPRLLLDLRSVLTDCSVSAFLQMYDQQHHDDAATSRPQEQSAPVIPVVNTPGVKTSDAPLHGRVVYDHHCSGCHGLNGDGKGLLATTLRPQPRDFTRGLFRYRSTPTGQLPNDEDLLRTVTVGLPGSTMPAWELFLSEAERRAVVAYLKHFSPRFATDTPHDVLPLSSPPTATTEGVAQGEKLYRESGCGSCHGETGKGDGRAGKELKTSEGDLIVPRDLTNKWSFRGGHLPQDMFQRLSTGMDGSPMASYRDVFSPTELWDLVFYILSLSPPERPQVQVLRDHGSAARGMAPLLTEGE